LTVFFFNDTDNLFIVASELGRKEQEEREKFRQLQEQGYKLKLEYMQQGKRTKDQKLVSSSANITLQHLYS
jgi:hypothetical protein